MAERRSGASTSGRNNSSSNNNSSAVIVLDSSDDDEEEGEQRQKQEQEQSGARGASGGAARLCERRDVGKMGRREANSSRAGTGTGTGNSKQPTLQQSFNKVKPPPTVKHLHSPGAPSPPVPSRSAGRRVPAAASSPDAAKQPPSPQTQIAPHSNAQRRRIQPTLLSSSVSAKHSRLFSDDDDEDDDDTIAVRPPPNRKPPANEPAETPVIHCTPTPKIPPKPIATQLTASPAGSKPKKESAIAVVQPPTPISAAFEALLSACRSADASADMERLISRKLLRYYRTVHPAFVGSKSFSKQALRVAAEIAAQPQFVYLKLAGILEELNIRRKSGPIAAAEAETETAPAATKKPAPQLDAAVGDSLDTSSLLVPLSGAKERSRSPDGGATTAPSPPQSPEPAAAPTTGNARKDAQIRKLNHALYILKKRIARLDEADVDLGDEDNSAYLLVERYKKRACEIYEKICDITGESKHACRETRKPIVFQGTAYPRFNRTIQSFVNRTRSFPDLFDVRRCLEHCNAQFDMGLSRDEVQRVAQDAFVKIGKLLQRRRKADLYETVEYFTQNGREQELGGVAVAEVEREGEGNGGEAVAGGSGAQRRRGFGALVDPAANDVQLQRKLADNEQDYRRKINEIIDRFAAEQDIRPRSRDAEAAPSTAAAASAEAGPSSGRKTPATSPAPATPPPSKRSKSPSCEPETVASQATAAQQESAIAVEDSSPPLSPVPLTLPVADDLAEASSPINAATMEDTKVKETEEMEEEEDANISCIILDDD